jgi:hypothetical protein
MRFNERFICTVALLEETLPEMRLPLLASVAAAAGSFPRQQGSMKDRIFTILSQSTRHGRVKRRKRLPGDAESTSSRKRAEIFSYKPP